MRTLIQNRDLKTLFGGVAVAAAVGLTLGMALYPNLDDDKVEGPQILMNGGGPRGEAPTSHATAADYGARVPDYVVGTDSLRPPQYEALAYDDRAEPEYADIAEAGDLMAYEAPSQVQATHWRDEPREPSRYPSEVGNRVHEVDLPAPPEPPGGADEDPLAD